MNLNDIKSYREKKISEFEQRKQRAIGQLNAAVEHYKKQNGASDSEVVLVSQKELTYLLQVKIDEMTWEQTIELQLGSINEEEKVYAVFDDIEEIDISSPQNSEFQKVINDRIIQAIDKEVVKYNHKITVF